MTESELKVEPFIGFFILDNLQIGATLLFNQKTTEFKSGTSSEKETLSAFMVNFAPSYVLALEKAYPYASVLVNLVRMERGNGSKTKSSLTVYGLQAGIKVKVIEGGLLNIGLLYNLGSGTMRVENTEFDLSSVSMIQLGLGFSLYK